MDKDIKVIPNINPDSCFDSDLSLLSMGHDRSISDEKNGASDQAYRSMEIMEGYARKTMYAMNKMSELNQHADDQFVKTAERISEIKCKANNKPHAAYVEQVSDAITQIAGQQMIGTLKIGATAIAGEVRRPISESSSANGKRGGLRRLLGG